MNDEEIFQKWAKEGDYRFFTTEDADGTYWLDGTANKSMFLKLMALARKDERIKQ